MELIVALALSPSFGFVVWGVYLLGKSAVTKVIAPESEPVKEQEVPEKQDKNNASLGLAFGIGGSLFVMAVLLYLGSLLEDYLLR